ncbi:MAG: hypothetical protein LBE91_08795 [Tannerella sp.]|jgi:hypothetical protein|nr:hypothetical protein [Tannerella sp.]
MIHTVYIDDEDIDGRELLDEIRRNRRGVRFAPLTTDGASPEGYMTVEEFCAEAKKSLTGILNGHGIY